jgi:hypothetical protein
MTYINKKGCGVTVAWLLGWHQLPCRQADAMSESGHDRLFWTPLA